MIIIHVPEIYQDAFFREAGYEKHPKYDHGYVCDMGPEMRWHAYCSSKTIKIHCDRTVEGFHRVFNNVRMDKEEKKRLAEVRRRIVPLSPLTPPNLKMKVGRKGQFAKDLKSIQHRKAVKRSIFNPLRYILGPIKIVK